MPFFENLNIYIGLGSRAFQKSKHKFSKGLARGIACL
jgi:hypothetical protein